MYTVTASNCMHTCGRFFFSSCQPAVMLYKLSQSLHRVSTVYVSQLSAGGHFLPEQMTPCSKGFREHHLQFCCFLFTSAIILIGLVQSYYLCSGDLVLESRICFFCILRERLDRDSRNVLIFLHASVLLSVSLESHPSDIIVRSA